MNCLEKEFFQKLNTKLTTAGEETMKEAKPKIQRVPAVLRNRKEKFSDLDLEKFYEPRWISIGPIHHGKPKYQLAERYKLDLAAKFIGDGGCKSWEEFDRKINEEQMGKILEECFSEDINYEHPYNEDLAKILFVDGCAVLQFIQSLCSKDSKRLKELKMKNDLIAFTNHDLFLLENQIPFRALSLLYEARPRPENSKNLEDLINDFISKNVTTPEKNLRVLSAESVYPEPAHLLDLLLSALLKKGHKRKHS